MEGEKNDVTYGSPVVDTVVRDALREINNYEWMLSARPGQTVVGEWDEHGFHATGKCGEFTLSTIPTDAMIACMVKKMEEHHPEVFNEVNIRNLQETTLEIEKFEKYIKK